MRLTEKALAYALLRIAVGVNIAGHGLIRLFYVGLSAFAHGSADRLAKSPLPHGFTLGFLYVVPFVETVVGVALVLGLLTRAALVTGSALMIALTIGVTSNQQWDAAATQLLYSFVLFVLLFLWEHNTLSVDAVLKK